jgi:guanylate kinase
MPREGESDGVQYFFVTEEAFRAMIAAGDFLEWAEVHGKLYGTPRSGVSDMLAAGKDVILEIDVQGARQVREKVPGAVAIFVAPPSAEVLEERLRKRGTEDEAELRRRLRNADAESREKVDYGYVIVNDQLYRAVEEFCAIYEKESPLQRKE